MSEFDPYRRWLGIPEKDQPPNHYRLLGIELFEPDPDIIDAAAEQRMLYVNQCANGPHVVHSQRLLNELSAARVCLVNPKQKVLYDAQLKEQLKSKSSDEVPVVQKPAPVPAAAPPATPPLPNRKEEIRPSFAVPPVVEPTVQESVIQRPAPAEIDAVLPVINLTGPRPSTSSSRPNKPIWKPWQALLVAVPVVGLCLGLTVWFLLSPGKPRTIADTKSKKTQSSGSISEDSSSDVKPEPPISITDVAIAPVSAVAINQPPTQVANLNSATKPNLEPGNALPDLDSPTVPTPADTSDTPMEPEPVIPNTTPDPNENNVATEIRDSDGEIMPERFDATRGRNKDDVREAQKTWAKYLNTELVTKHKDIELLLIPAGIFLMGGGPAAAAGPAQPLGPNKLAAPILRRNAFPNPVARRPIKAVFEDNVAQVRVTLTKPFFLGKTEVTRKQWRRVMNSRPWHPEWPDNKKDENWPATNMTWNDAEEFCNRLSEAEGVKFRLPSEAEWEFACRAGTCTDFSFGNKDAKAGDYVKWVGNAPGSNPKLSFSVHELSPNFFGLHDMHGNASEWCADSYQKALPGGLDPLVSPGVSGSGICRGGSCKDAFLACRSFCRFIIDRSESRPNVGFRLARVVEKRSLPTSPQPSPTVPASNAEELPSLAGFDGNLARTFDKACRDAELSQKAWSEHLKTPVNDTNSIGMALVLIPPGKFKMGSVPGPDDKRNQGQLEVTLTEPFYVGKTEVTQQQWIKVMRKDASPWVEQPETKNDSNYPATYVSWKKAKAFCDQLTNLDPAKGKYRLLTDAEWEYACRGGTTTQHYFGDSDKELGPFAWFAGNAKNKNENYPHEVGLMKPNSFGLNDMHGNVMEWCEDWYEDRLKGGINPVVAVGSKSRVRRGGSWESDSDKCLSAYRFPESSDKQASTIGFRVVREIIVGK